MPVLSDKSLPIYVIRCGTSFCLQAKEISIKGDEINDWHPSSADYPSRQCMGRFLMKPSLPVRAVGTINNTVLRALLCILCNRGILSLW
jgi:hypothetical protein